MLSMITGAVGALGGILGEIDRAKRATTLKRMEEDYTRMGAAGMMRDREQNQMVNPQAAAQQRTIHGIERPEEGKEPFQSHPIFFGHFEWTELQPIRAPKRC